MIDLEQRLGIELGVIADGISERSADVDRPRRLARRRRRNRRIGWSVIMALLTVVGVGAVVRLATADSRVESVDEIRFDEQGVPVDTGPELAWRALGETDDLGLRGIVWSGEYFVGTANGGEADHSLYRSADGLTWEPIEDPLVTSMNAVTVRYSDGRLLTWGFAGGIVDDVPGATALAISDDHGATWRSGGELIPQVAQDDPTDLVDVGHQVMDVAVVGDTVAALIFGTVGPDPYLALLDQGLIDVADKARIDGFRRNEVGGSFEVTYCVESGSDGGCSPEDRRQTVVTIPELAGSISGLELESTTVALSVDGGAFETVFAVDGLATGLVSSNGRFVLPASAVDGGAGVFTSEDGVAWELETETDELLDLDGWDSVLASPVVADVGTDYWASTSGGQTWSVSRLPIGGVHESPIGPGGHLVGPDTVIRDRGVIGDVVSWVTGNDDPEPTVIGWSADGEHWGWQEWSETFDGHGWGTFAVGEDTVIALVHHQGDEEWRPTVYVADIPEAD
ncbi:MAG: hypothetical protein AAF962_08155 [Actinomycetota bacterium]